MLVNHMVFAMGFQRGEKWGELRGFSGDFLIGESRYWNLHGFIWFKRTLVGCL